MNLVMTSKFKPFSYQEMLAPVLAATQEHMQQEDALAELDIKSSVWENMANEQTEPYAHAMYKKYSDDLKKQAEVLASQGLTPGSRKELNKLRGRYTQEITPIEQAYTRRKELVDEQRKIQATDNTMMFDKNASELSLEDLIKNPALTTSSYSGNLLYKQSVDAVQNLAKQMRDNPREWKDVMGNQYFETLMQRGFRPEDIMAYLKDPNAQPVLKTIVDSVVDSSGISSWNNPQALDRARREAERGVWSAIGQDAYDVQTNRAYDYGQRAALKGKEEESDYDGNQYARPHFSTTAKEAESSTEMKDDMIFLQEVLKNPNILNVEAQRPIAQLQNMNSGGPPLPTVDKEKTSFTYKPNAERLFEIGKKYGVNIYHNVGHDGTVNTNVDKVMPYIEKKIKAQAIRSVSYGSNITDGSQIAQVIENNVDVFSTNTGRTGLREYKEGKIGKEVPVDKYASIFDNKAETHLSYKPTVGVVLNYTSGTGDKKQKGAVVIDPELLDDGKHTIANTMKSIDVLVAEGDQEAAAVLANELMKLFYYKFNTLVKKQSSTTSSEIAPVGGKNSSNSGN